MAPTSSTAECDRERQQQALSGAGAQSAARVRGHAHPRERPVCGICGFLTLPGNARGGRIADI